MTDDADVQVRGRTVEKRAIQIEGRTVVTTGRWLKIAAARDEELVEGDVVADPHTFLRQLRGSELRADLFTFAQKLPDTTPRHPFHLEWDNPAVIPLTTFAEWWEKRVESSVRRAVRKASKLGVVTRVTDFDSTLVDGIVEIYNESPVRQGRAFWHYQKDIEAVRRENSTYLERSRFIGAYYNDELIGFLRMVYVDKMASIIQVLSKIKHFAKRPTNAMIAKAVEVCVQDDMTHLVYCFYTYNDPQSSLTEFKRRNGFEQVLLPRYYVPLTPKGMLALRLGLHRELAGHIPKPLLTPLLRLRKLWNERRRPGATEAPAELG